MSKEVQATGLDAVVSKLSSSSLGYFPDEFLPLFVPEKERRRRAPLINRGYYARFRVFELVLRRFERLFPGDRQIVSLGGGSETIWYRLKKRGAQPKVYVELDLAPVTLNKQRIMEGNESLSSLLQPRDSLKESEEVRIHTPEYRVVTCDLADASQVERVLAEHLDPSLPTMFLSECVLVYVDPEASGQVIELVANKFPQAHFLTYEQINPYDPFGAQMMANLKRRGCELKGISAHPDLPSQERRFLSRGWTTVSAMDMKSLYYQVLAQSDRERIEKLEIFDEFEEFFLIMQHYSITLAKMQQDSPLSLVHEEEDELGFV